MVRSVIILITEQVLLVDVLLCRRHVTVSHHGVSLSALLVKLILVNLLVLSVNIQRLHTDLSSSLELPRIVRVVDIPLVFKIIILGELLFRDLLTQLIFLLGLHFVLLRLKVIGRIVNP